VLCDLYPRAWTTNGPQSNLFGLEPNFGCCTSNMHQGWPKFVANLWMASPGDGLVAAAYGPSEVKTTVRGGIAVKITEETEYPFRGTVRLLVAPAKAATFPLLLRIPAWAAGTAITVNGTAVEGVKASTFHRIERRWKSGDTVELRFPSAVRFTNWYRDSVAVERGPLVFSLKMGEEWRKVRDRPQAPDWAVYPATPWNYALLANTVEVREKPIGDYPFSPEGAPVELRVKGRLLPEWSLWEGSAGPLPASPVKSNRPLEELTLIPYGSAKLRITAFPRLAE
ncbi:MAG: glycoside hydrolase family 127 protein, partial [Acidobacteria bacterium]|nr:glycoside hydrolase family 127 protein [Acidobacteriota bacterium]